MRKLELRDWAAVAEIVGTIAVVVSLLFVVQSLNRNSAIVSSSIADNVYAALREIELSALNNPELLNVIIQGRDNPESLSAREMDQYARYVAMYVDEWDRIDTRERLGLLRSENVAGWHTYFESWIRKHVTPETWEEIKWNYADSGISERVEAALSK